MTTTLFQPVSTDDKVPRPAARLLLVDDDVRLAIAVRGALNRRGYLVQYARTAAEALAGGRPDLIVLDPRLPGEDGPSLCGLLRRYSDVGIIVATRDGCPPRWAADAADDHITKPYALPELHARLQAVLRRRQTLRVGPLCLDLDRGLAVLGETRLALTRKEFQLLAVLARTPSEVVSRRLLAGEVWQTAGLGKSRTVDVHVAMVRAKVAPLLGVESMRGVGYRLVVPPA